MSPEIIISLDISVDKGACRTNAHEYIIDKVLEQNYINYMNAVISLDVEVFREAEREAEYLQVSVPELCSMAILEFVKNHHKDSITRKVNAVYSTYKAEIDEDILQAQYD